MHLSKRRFDVLNSRQVILLVIPPIFLALATLVVAIRWHARKTKRINTLVEDALCLCSLAMCLLVTILVLVLVLVDGQGMSTAYVREKLGEQVGIRGWLRTQFILDVCWALSVAVVQLFLLQFYTRLYSHCRRLLYLCYSMMVLVAAWFIYALVAWAMHCRSPIMAMAVPAVYSMDFFARRRLSVAGLFLLGTFCTLCGIFRMECCFYFFGDYTTDPISSSWGRMLFSPLEIAVGIIACSIPTLAPFQKFWGDEGRSPPSRKIALRKLGVRSGSEGSSVSELKLNPANWGKSGGKVSVFVSLGDGEAGPNTIKVTKQYDIGHRP
ncbi:hypothetical protein K458DRAFT_409012 [Lentithecium fluviatile CBS 122367]|uniref:Rhodopsin domain-containing protein n=1 Tax=Lentithecium fluviatile CBS 122367 TaxID=1168545 RepID=A0A6G1IJJ3_9PLEO|nr:hypothetical protein K458DRAFT_409012 [Lentithecium fluviatile CBS 122367]